MTIRYALVAIAGLLAHSSTVAHHSFAAEFDYDLRGTIEGEVIEALFVNPHARYFIAVIDEQGNEIIWDAQTRSPSALTRIGWSRDSIQVGDHVTLEGNLGLDDTRKIWIQKVTKGSGEEIFPTAQGAGR